MKILAISGLMLAVAAASVSAAPAKEETGERVSYTEDKKPAKRAPTGDWVEIASPTPATHGREYISVGGRFSMLRIDAAKGRPIVRTVRVFYTDGKQRFVRIDRVLGGKRATALVELSGEPIDHLIVVSDRQSKGTYTVQGAPVTSGVAAR